MIKTYTVGREEELLALLHPKYGFHLLGQFGEPCTASEAARKMGESATKLSYHVGRLQELGLLVPAAAEVGRGQPFQTVAGRFVLAPELFPLLSNELVRPMLQALVDAFLAANGGPEPDSEHEYVLMDLQKAHEAPLRHDWHKERRGVEVQQFRLSKERYAALMTDLQERIGQEMQATGKDQQDKWHTIALMGFPGNLLPMAEKETP